MKNVFEKIYIFKLFSGSEQKKIRMFFFAKKTLKLKSKRHFTANLQQFAEKNSRLEM